MRFLRAALAASLLLAPLLAAAQQVHIEADLAPLYHLGDEGLLTINVRLDDPDTLVDEAVLFLNVIRYRENGGYVQATHRIFSAARAEPDIFLKVLDGEALRDGVTTTVDFRLRRRARLGEYALVLQLFTGTNTNPNRVREENRIALEHFRFTMLRP